MSLSPDQLETRRLGITATDISAVLGVNPWRSPLDVWRDKTEPSAEPRPDTERSVWGQRLEPLIRSDYELRHGCRVEVPGTLRKPHEEWAIATPDGLCYFSDAYEPERGLEIKVHGRDAVRFGRLHYGEPGTDDIPMHELCQDAWGMHITGLRRWDHVVFLDGAPIEFIVDRDDELIEMMRDAATRFMRDHIEAKVPPSPDGSDSWDRYLRKIWDHKTDELVDISSNMAACTDVERLREARAQAAELEKEIEAIVQRLKNIIGNNAGLLLPIRGPGGRERITWKRNKPSVVTDLVAIVADVRLQAAAFASGRSEELDAIEHALLKYGGGHVGTSTFSGIALKKAFTEMRQTLIDIAKLSCEKQHQATEIGARPFRVPASWGKSKEH